jgi:hypothetical protein
MYNTIDAVEFNYYESLEEVKIFYGMFICRKSTTLRNIFSIHGADHVHITGPDTHLAVIVFRAAGTTIQLGIDDIRSAKKAKSIAVQFFNGSSHNTCQSGELKPHTSVVITSNATFCDSERYTSTVGIIHT